jgi:hypothetical protein
MARKGEMYHTELLVLIAISPKMEVVVLFHFPFSFPFSRMKTVTTFNPPTIIMAQWSIHQFHPHCHGHLYLRTSPTSLLFQEEGRKLSL